MKKLLRLIFVHLLVFAFFATRTEACPIFYYYNSLGLGIGASTYNGQYFRNLQLSREGQIYWQKKDSKYHESLNYNLSISSSDYRSAYIRSIKLGIASNELLNSYDFGFYLSPNLQYSNSNFEGSPKHQIGPGIELNIRPYSLRYSFLKLSFEYTRLMNMQRLINGSNYVAMNLSLCLSTLNGRAHKGNRSPGGFNF